ncbi:MAG: hypothetical protein ABFD79_12320 [Phycisphaerales bacterium]
MTRKTGTYKTTTIAGEKIQAFIPYPLPPQNPTLRIEEKLDKLHNDTISAIKQLSQAASIVPSVEWFLYGFCS